MYYFIVNPVSGSGRGRKVWKKIKRELHQNDIAFHAFVLRSQGEAYKIGLHLARSRQQSTIVVVGGDGTINETINGLCHGAISYTEDPMLPFTPELSHITLACIPTGSGNDFVRGMKMETDPIKAVKKVLAAEKIGTINIGQVKTEGSRRSDYFIVSSGFGYDAVVCDKILLSPMKKALNLFHIGKLVYLFTALKMLLTMKLQDYSIEVDDQEPVTYPKAYFAAAMNLPYEGGGFFFTPKAMADDDELDLFVAYNIPRLKVLYLLPKALSGKHVDYKGIKIQKCKKITIHTANETSVHTDGEVPLHTNNVSYQLINTKIKVINT